MSHYALWGPDNLDLRLKTAAEMVHLADQLKDREWALRSREMYLADLLETGSIQDADTALRTYKELCEETALENPMVELVNAMRAMLRADFAEGERLAERAMTI